jgi:PPOX class probable F420-dependent enzyme
MTTELDTTTDAGRHVERRLREEELIWLTTVRSNGQPQPMPVWVLWDGATFLIFSRPDAPKLRNIRHNPLVALNLHADEHGDDVVRVEGTAEILQGPPQPADVGAMLEKYREGIARLGTIAEGFAGAYSTAIRITPNRFHVW